MIEEKRISLKKKYIQYNYIMKATTILVIVSSYSSLISSLIRIFLLYERYNIDIIILDRNISLKLLVKNENSLHPKIMKT